MGDPDLWRVDLGEAAQQFRPVGVIRDDEGKFDPALLGALPDAHPARRGDGHRIGQAPRPAVGERGWRRQHDGAGQRARAGGVDGGEGAERDARALVDGAEPGQRAMDVDGRVPARLAQQPDDALALAQRVDADEMGTLRTAAHRGEQPRDLAAVVGVDEDRQAERGLGDENVAGLRLEGRAGGITPALVVSRDDHAGPRMFEHDLGGSQHVPGGGQPDRDIADADLLAIGRRLQRVARGVAVAGAHDGERAGGRQHGGVARARMIGMRVGDHRPRHRARGIDMEIARLDIEALGRRPDPGLGAHGWLPQGSVQPKMARRGRVASLRVEPRRLCRDPGAMSDTHDPATLPMPLAEWFAGRGWTAHAHQLAVLAAVTARRSVLLVAPTGGGKTLAGFLPSLGELAAVSSEGLHTLYVSPLKALAVDIKRNLELPVGELGLGIRIETRTGDTPAARRARQRAAPPHILLTTPESLALMLADPAARAQFAGLRQVVVDEIHSLEGGKRGDLLALGLARLAALAPHAVRIGLSATVADPPRLAAWLGAGLGQPPVVVRGRGGVRPDIRIVLPEARLPWGGHMALGSMPEVYGALREARSAIVFVNTRAQAELCFQELWKLNTDNLPIALHHGSLATEQRRKVEAAMAAGRLRAVVATSSLDLGIDWGDVDLVVQVGAPKGAARLLQRIGRSNHRLDAPSRALLVPANRFELLECEAAIEAVAAGEIDAPRPRAGGLDVLAQHVLGCACHGPFDADALHAEIRTAAPYAALTRRDFDDVLAFVATGGYALQGYDRFRRLFRASDGTWRIVGPHVARQYRLNVGTIVEAPMVTLMLGRRRKLGEVEEWFAQGLEIGDTFAFGGQLLRFEGMRETFADVSAARDGEPKVPVYEGGRLPLTTELAARVRALIADPGRWDALPAPVRDWLRLQRAVSVAPRRDGLLVEIFPRGGKMFLVAYCFEGRYAHQTLGMLLTRRMERAGLHPLGFVATDYVIAVWSLRPPLDVAGLFAEDMLGDDLEEWMAESSMLRRSFRNVAIVAGLIERRHPGMEKSGRQVTFSADLIYDVLRRHEPDHVLLRATRADAAAGMADVARLGAFLARIRGRIDVERLDRVSPLAVPVLLEIGRESVRGAAVDELLDETARALIDEAVGPAPPLRQPRLL